MNETNKIKTNKMKINWKVPFFTSSVLMILWSLLFLIIHFGLSIPWFIFGIYNYAVFNLFLIFADISFIVMGIIAIILILTQKKSKNTKIVGTGTIFKFRNLILIILISFILVGFTIAYPFILVLQWTSQFATVKSLLNYFGYTKTLIPPSVAVLLCCIVLIMRVFASVSAIGYLINCEPELWMVLKGDNRFEVSGTVLKTVSGNVLEAINLNGDNVVKIGKENVSESTSIANNNLTTNDTER